METSSTPNTSSFQSLPRKKVIWTLVGTMLALFLSSLDQTIVGTAMPRIVADLNGFNHYTWVTTSYIITSAITLAIIGKLNDMYGRKIFYVAGLIIFLVASLACGFSYTMTQLIIFRGVQGIGGGILMANAFIVIGDLFSPAERGKYQGYMSGIFALSSVIGPTLGGFLTDSLSWHWVFFINVPLGIFIIAIFIKFFPNIRPDNLKHSIDYPGLSILILTIAPAMLALSWGGVEYPWASVQIIGMLIFAAVMLILFLFIESRAREPIIPLSLFKNRIVTVSFILSFLSGIGMFSAIIYIPLFLQGVLGASAATSGNLLIPMMMGMVVGALVTGHLLSHKGGHYRIIALVGAAIMCLGLALLSRITVSSSYTAVAISTVIVGLGLGATMPIYTIVVQNAIADNMLGVATSSTSFFRSLGGSVGLAILGSVMNNRFATEFLSKIPDSVKSVVPADMLSSLANNPQALVSPDAQSHLKEMLSQMGAQGTAQFDQILQGLRKTLASSISEVFTVTLIILILALVASFFLKEIPLRKSNITEDATPKCKPES